MTENQKATIDHLISIGGEVQEGVNNCVWFLGRCLLVDSDGEMEEL